MRSNFYKIGALLGFLFLLPLLYSNNDKSSVAVEIEVNKLSCPEGTKAVKEQIKEFEDTPDIGVSQTFTLEKELANKFLDITAGVNVISKPYDSVIIIVGEQVTSAFIGVVNQGCIVSWAVAPFEMVKFYLQQIEINLVPKIKL